MNGTTEKLKAIVELIIKQRFKVGGDIFRYDFSRIKDELNTLADSDKYGIDPIEQRELLEKLDEGENDSFELDYVDKIEDEFGIFTSHWRYGYGWLKEYLYPEFQPESYPYDVFIRLNFKGVEELKLKYEIKCYEATLKYDSNMQRFTVICNGKEYTFKKSLTNGADTTKMIEFAWKHRGNYITTDSINKYANLREPVERIDSSLKHCSVVVEVLKPFFDYNDRKIRLNDSALLTVSELEPIKLRTTVRDILGQN